MPHAQVTLPGSTSSVPTARRFVESIVSSWGQPDLGWTAALVVSELAANAALHAHTSFTVTVVLDDLGTVRLEVSDGSRRLPQQRGYGIDATTGRGLRLVEEIATAWGTQDRADGKTIWAVLDPASHSTTPGDDDEADVDAILRVHSDHPQAAGPPSGGGRALTAQARLRRVAPDHHAYRRARVVISL